MTAGRHTPGLWVPTFERWRHGGWYVTNLRHQAGGIGCVSNNYPDGKWRIVCGPEDATFSSRADAANAERVLIISRDRSKP